MKRIMSVYRLKVSVILPVFVLASCSAQQQSTMTDAVITPLNDLNFMQVEIPAVLIEAQKAPYAVPANQNCPSLNLSIRGLDEVLGPDLDASDSETDPDLIELGTSAAEDTVAGSMRSTVESVVPFRSWVRKLSGAERYSKKAADAITAGNIRRAFLKGLKASTDCP